MNFCKKIGNKYFCLAKTREQQALCRPGQINRLDDYCQYMKIWTSICNIGDLIESDQKKLDEEAKI